MYVCDALSKTMCFACAKRYLLKASQGEESPSKFIFFRTLLSLCVWSKARVGGLSQENIVHLLPGCMLCHEEARPPTPHEHVVRVALAPGHQRLLFA